MRFGIGRFLQKTIYCIKFSVPKSEKGAAGAFFFSVLIKSVISWVAVLVD